MSEPRWPISHSPEAVAEAVERHGPRPEPPLDRAALVAAVDGLRNPYHRALRVGYEGCRDAVLALLNTLPAAPTIDPAWHRVTEALPEGWHFDVLRRDYDGSWQASAEPDPSSRRTVSGSMWLGVGKSAETRPPPSTLWLTLSCTAGRRRDPSTSSPPLRVHGRLPGGAEA